MSEQQPQPQERSKIVPNTFQTPNVLVDDLMRMMTGDEVKCYLVVTRKTFGWLKRTDRIAKSQIVELTGLSENTVDECMKTLTRFNLIRRLAENDPSKNIGVEWEIQTDDSAIYFSEMLYRKEQKNAKNLKRTEKMNWGGGVVARPQVVARTGGGVVARTPQKPLSKARKKESTANAPQKNWVDLTNSEALAIPEIKTFVQATGWIPGSFVLQTVYDYMSAGIDSKKLAAAFSAWCAKGYNPRNVQGYLEWARDGIPASGPKYEKKGTPPNANNSRSYPISEPTDADIELARSILADQERTRTAHVSV